MKDADKDRSPEKALKRARSDFRCAARKLGLGAARDALRELEKEEAKLPEGCRLPSHRKGVADD